MASEAVIDIYYFTEHGTAPTHYTTYNSPLILTEEHLPTLTADGYRFVGWYSTSTFDTGTEMSVGDTLSWGSYYFYAKWTERSTVTDQIIRIKNEVTSQTEIIEQIKVMLSGKVAVTPVLQEKTVTPSTSSQLVTPDSGYDGLSKVTVAAVPNASGVSF